VAVTVSIKVKKKNELIDIISIYIANGNNCLEEEVNQIAHHPNCIILGGDFNGHHLESGNPIATNRTKAKERWIT
jgi:hypothetical protein